MAFGLLAGLLFLAATAEAQVTFVNASSGRAGTRFYLQNAAADVDPATERGAWNSTTGYVARKLARTKAGAIATRGNGRDLEQQRVRRPPAQDGQRADPDRSDHLRHAELDCRGRAVEREHERLLAPACLRAPGRRYPGGCASQQRPAPGYASRRGRVGGRLGNGTGLGTTARSAGPDPRDHPGQRPHRHRGRLRGEQHKHHQLHRHRLVRRHRRDGPGLDRQRDIAAGMARVQPEPVPHH